MQKFILSLIVGASASAAIAQDLPAAGPPASPAETPSPGPPTTAASAPATTIEFLDKGPNGMSDLPMGVHRIPESNIIISGHQKGGGIGILFGLVGMLAQSSANAQAGTSKVRNVEDDLRFDVTAKARELTQALLADEQFRQHFTLSPGGKGAILNVTPYVAITFQGENQVRPYVVLKTKYASGASGDAGRTIKYFCCEGKPLPLVGEQGLAENNGAGLKQLLTAELETAIQVMLRDRSQPYTRSDQAKVLVEGYYPFVGKPFKMKGFDLGTYKDYSLVDFRAGILVFGGVNIAEPESLDIQPIKPKSK